MCRPCPDKVGNTAGRQLRDISYWGAKLTRAKNAEVKRRLGKSPKKETNATPITAQNIIGAIPIAIRNPHPRLIYANERNGRTTLAGVPRMWPTLEQIHKPTAMSAQTQTEAPLLFRPQLPCGRTTN